MKTLLLFIIGCVISVTVHSVFAQSESRDGNNFSSNPQKSESKPNRSNMPKTENRDGNNFAPAPSKSESESKPKLEKATYSDRYRERYSSEGYRDRYNSANYRENMIQDGWNRRREHFSGDSPHHYEYLETGVRLAPPPTDNTRNMNVELNGDSSVFHSGKGMRLPFSINQPRPVDPMRQQQLRSLLQAPTLLQQYVGTPESNNEKQPEGIMPEPVGNFPQGFQQPQYNVVPGNQSLIPPVNQPLNPQPVDLQPNGNLSLNQPLQQPINQPVPLNSLPYPMNVQQQNQMQYQIQNQMQNQPNNPNVMLPFPMNNQVQNQNQVQNRNVLYNNTLNTRPYSSQRNPALNQRYQSRANSQSNLNSQQKLDDAKTENPSK